MVRSLSCVAAVVASALASAGQTAAACDRAVVAVVQPQVLSFAPAQVVTPLAAPSVSSLAVAPLVVVPLDAAPVVVAAGGGHAVIVRSARAVAVRPLIVRPSRTRSVTRVRTLVR